MKKSSGHLQSRFRAGERIFQVQVLRLANGCFLSISEGEDEKMGALTLAIRTGGTIHTSVLVPGRSSSTISSILAEMVANVTEGICITSFHALMEVDGQVMKTIIDEVKRSIQKQRGLSGDA